MQWAKLDELLDKLLFLAVSGDGMSRAFVNILAHSYVIRFDVLYELLTHLSAVCYSPESSSRYAKAYAPARQSLWGSCLRQLRTNEVNISSTIYISFVHASQDLSFIRNLDS
jgi:hypothetical protein